MSPAVPRPPDPPCSDVPAVDPEVLDRARRRGDALAKPPGSLGALESLGARLAGMAGTCPPPVPHSPALLIVAGDHGVHATGVSPWPQAVTALMVANFVTGGAAANALADTVGARMTVLDVGVAEDLPPIPPGPDRAADLVARRVRAGTRDLSTGDALTDDEVTRAMLAGREVVDDLVAGGVDLLVLGDMGIANTTASAVLVASLTGADPAAVTGRGTGIDDDLLERKVAIVAAAVDRVAGRDPLGLLAGVGGLEHAAMVGAMVAAASHRVPVVLDGVITDAAALVATAWCPALRDHLVAGHLSVEPGARVALDRLGLDPLVDLDLRLGEGTGGLLAVPIVRSAAAALAGMARLDDLLAE